MHIRIWPISAKYRTNLGVNERLPNAIIVRITDKDSGQRLDAFIAKKMTSRNAAQRLLATDQVMIDHQVITKPAYRLRTGEKIFIKLPRPQATTVCPEAVPLDILFEDADVVVVNKSKGMVVHPAPGNPTGTLVNAILHHCGHSLSGVGGVLRPGIVHRLDKDTSGAIIIAKNDLAHLHLAAQIKEHSARRIYVALVHGSPPAKGIVDAPIGRHPIRRLEMAVVPKGKPAVTHFHVLEQLGPYALIEARLETGRTHQIRVHMAYGGFPVVGDPLYGPRKIQLFTDGQALHAWQLSFQHPRLGVRMICVATLPPTFAGVLAKLRDEFGKKGVNSV